MNRVIDATQELERLFTAVAPWFHLDLPKPVITIQSKGRKSAYAWFANDRWKNDAEEPLNEINFCAEHLARSPIEIGETMVHEVCHLANRFEGIRDCTANQYHNKAFKRRAESVGLVCEESNRGWATTSCSPELEAKLKSLNINEDAFSLYRLSPAARQTKKTNLRKWRCECTNVWSKTDINAICVECQRPFVG